MVFWVLMGLASLSSPALAGTAWREPAAETQLQEALQVLQRLSTGRDILRRAVHAWGLASSSQVYGRLRAADASRTDAVLTRTFDPKTGKETRQRHVTIYLRTRQALHHVVLDLAHEIIHATTSPTWDPYDPKLTSARYMTLAIEGEGGEIDAVTYECRVALEMSDRFGVSPGRCEGYLATAPQGVLGAKAVSRDRVRRDFYRVGKWHAEVTERLGAAQAQFPLLSREEPKLYSSTGRTPYPMALLKEFEEITQIACENTRRRLQAAPDRRPAEASELGAGSGDTGAQAFLRARCGSTSASAPVR